MADTTRVEIMASANRQDPVTAYLPDVDRTLITRNLELSVEDRFLQLMELQRLADELQESRRRRDSA